MNYDMIEVHLSSEVACVSMNRPEVMNALNTQMRAEITDAYKRLAPQEPGEEGEIRFKRARVGWRTNRSPRRLAALVIRIDEATHRRSAHE